MSQVISNYTSEIWATAQNENGKIQLLPYRCMLDVSIRIWKKLRKRSRAVGQVGCIEGQNFTEVFYGLLEIMTSDDHHYIDAIEIALT